MKLLRKIGNAIQGFLTDSKSKPSMTRLLSFILVLNGVILAYIEPDYHTAYLGMITLGLGGKLVQKHIEK